MLAHAVAAEVGGGVLRGGAAVWGMFLSIMLTVSLTFTGVGSVSITGTLVALGHGSVLNKELIVLELSVVEQALLHQNVSFHGSPHLQVEGPMRFAVLQCLDTPGYTKDFDS